MRGSVSSSRIVESGETRGAAFCAPVVLIASASSFASRRWWKVLGTACIESTSNRNEVMSTAMNVMHARKMYTLSPGYQHDRTVPGEDMVGDPTSPTSAASPESQQCGCPFPAKSTAVAAPHRARTSTLM